VTAVLRAWGRDVTYAQVEGLSGMAFSPACNDGEDCIGWKMDGANERRVDFLGQCLGFTAERVEYAGDGEWLAEYQASGAMPAGPAAYFARLHDALLAGKAVIPHTWPAWSVLTGWADDFRKLPFATTPRFDKVVASIYPPWKANWAIILTPQDAPGTCDVPGALLAHAVAFGATIASDEAAGGDVRFGSAIFDTIRAYTGQPFLCPACRENGCLGRSFKRIADGQDACIHFLGDARLYMPDPVGQAALDEAIAAYTEMQAITGKYLDWPKLKDRHDLPEFRRQIAADCEAEKRLLARAAGHLKLAARSHLDSPCNPG
jgi:hypothetical protein